MIAHVKFSILNFCDTGTANNLAIAVLSDFPLLLDDENDPVDENMTQSHVQLDANYCTAVNSDIEFDAESSTVQSMPST
jgi:hypothetical protein